MEDTWQKLIRELGPLRVRTDEPLFRHTTFKIGGPAALFFEAHSQEDLIGALKTCGELKIPFFVLGRGSNILVSDKGFPGLVIKNKSEGIRILRYKGQLEEGQTRQGVALVEVDSGVGLNRLVRFAIEESLAGLEVFLSIPGSVGGAVKTNAHFRPEKDEFLGSLVYKAQLFDKKGEVKEVDRDYFQFDYDRSRLQETGEVLLRVVFKLDRVSSSESLWKKAQKAVDHRRLRQPFGEACAGCIFKNPPQSRPAGFFLDQAGLKGTRVGGAVVSEKHANFIVNTGGATAADVLELINLCREKVKVLFGIELEREIEYVGDF